MNSTSATPQERVSRRRTTARFGCVNFPVEDPRYHSTGEGGMFVKLVVTDDRDYDESDWTICCGVAVVDHRSEEFVGDDQAQAPQLPPLSSEDSPEKSLTTLQAHDATYRAWEERHFPSLYADDDQTYGKYVSRGYLAALVLANTGWSGYSDETGYWCCTYDDLTAEGKALYASLQALYPGCQLHLLTFLDT